MSDQNETPPPDSRGGDDMVWAITGTLLAGPAVWGLVGFGVDRLFDTGLFLPLGVVFGAIASFYIVYVRFGRD